MGLLLSIALLPLLAPHDWEKNRTKGIVAAVFALPVAGYLVLGHGAAGAHTLIEKGQEYVSFILLLTALFVITGGIHVRGSLSGTPLFNTLVLGFGAVLANAIGTTGASVLLIRPLLRANAPRVAKSHIVVFFIFVVSNCGGLLTPLGDPPLFLGYLKGVPFEWTLRFWREWALVNGLLLVVFNVWDQIVFDREEMERPGSQLEEVQRHAPIGVTGVHNCLLLLGVPLVVFFAPRLALPWGIQEVALAGLAATAWLSTRSDHRASNGFTWAPLVEVAVLFAGIFVTMAPALLILNAWGAGHREVMGMAFGLSEPWEFYWATGLLSSFLDNAPTYLSFAATSAGFEGISADGPRYLGELLLRGEAAVRLMAAISCGSVMMGAVTYIGNGPNFMVKAIAEENGVRMPGFFGYMAYSGAILIPIFVVVTLVFFR